MGAVNARESHIGDDFGKHEHEEPTPAKEQIPLDGIAATVVAVNVDGLARTKNDIVMDSVKELFKVQHFEDLVLKAQDCRGRLQELGCFSNVGIHIDTSETGSKDYVVTFNVQELKKVVGSVNTMVGNNEGSLLTGVKMPNLAGRGERLQAEYTYGTKKSSSFNISLAKPLPGSTKPTLTGNLFQATGEFPASGFKNINRGLLLDLSFISAPQVAHNLQWEGVWRDLSAVNRSCSFAVREHSGHTLKSALKHILSVDRRDDTIFPREGTLFRLNQEFAGIGGNIGFFKNELELQANVPIYNDISAQGSFNAGIIKDLRNEKTFNISDHFFLGGPNNIRGFDLCGVGPHSDGSSMGGTMYWASGLHLYTPLPFRPGAGGLGDLFRSHVFVTGGNIGNFWLTGNVTRDMEAITQDFRLSYGLGLAIKLGGVARIELNYCLPVKASRGDKAAPGLQLGVGVNFL